MEYSGVLLVAVLGVAPVLAVEVLEREGPVAGQPDAPVPHGDEQQDGGGGPAMAVCGPQGKHHGRRDAPVGVIDGDVAEQQPEKPHHDRGRRIGDEQLPEVVPAAAGQTLINKQPDREGEHVNDCYDDKTKTARLFDGHRRRFFDYGGKNTRNNDMLRTMSRAGSTKRQ